ncbi:uncharacterized protein LOC100251651 isoform X1 [Vitis vinifera]|nr:uncharacterized protein LOC100251651 isoform X1 [Vitis vinifera]|eukprot:XP_010656540.1 PREDICTED: uncharacterized protein LOC100251651 isoform X1 [Vitis vinifera]
MAFDQNSIPLDLRPLNVPRTMVEDPRIAPATTTGRTTEGVFPNPARDAGSPGSVQMFYPATVSDAGLVGLGFGNAVPGVAAWCPHVPVAIGRAGISPGAIGLGYNPNLGTRVAGNASDQASDEGTDDSNSGKKVKFLCSFGGKILPRPSDGMLRYVGGHTRIICLRRDVSFNELVQKMVDTYGQPVVIKYQLPEEDLDALVSVSCPDDLENMMDEYEKLVERSSDGSAKLRVFLFSASELDPSDMVQFGNFNDSGQRYFDAVNGIMDGIGGGIARKESIASATSTQNSDVSGNDATDNLVQHQGDVSGPPFSSALSPKGNSATSNEPATRLMCVDPNPAIYADVSAIPLGIPVGNTGPPQTSSSKPDVEFERSVPLTVQPQQVGFDLQQCRMDIPATTAYLQSYVHPHREVTNHADYVQVPHQMGFPNQLLATSGSVLTHQQIRDNASGVSSHQFIPAVHMTMTPTASHVSIRPSVIQPLVQPQQARIDCYTDESTFGPRVVQLPLDQSYNPYQAQVPLPPAVVGGYGWHQVPAQDHVVLSDGWAHQQVILPETTTRLEDCFMCQKELPHAHSDPLVQGLRDSSASSVSDSNSAYHSLRLEDNVRARQINRVVVTGALGEGIIEQGVGAQPRVLGHMDHQAGTLQSEVVGICQNLDAQHENEKIILQKMDNPDQPRVPIPQGVVGLAGAVQSSYGVFTGTIPQTSQEEAVQQYAVPTQYQVKPDTLVNRPINSDVPLFGGVPLQTSERLVQESPRDYSGKLPGVVPKEDTAESCISFDHMRPIDERMENLRVGPAENFVNSEQSKSSADKPRKEDILEHRLQQIAGKEVLLDSTFSKAKIVVESNHNKATEVLPCSAAEVPYLHNVWPVETYEVTKLPILGTLATYTHSKTGIHNVTSGEVSYGSPAFSDVESAYLTDKAPPISEWNDDTSQFQPKMVPTDIRVVSSNGNTPYLSPSNRIGDVQDSSNSLFSSQDPWNLRHDIHFPPPRPNKITIKNEAFSIREPFGENGTSDSGDINTDVQLEDGAHQPFSNLDKDFNSEHSWSAKGSGEEVIKQELQAIAEGVAASVLHSTTSNPEISIHEKNEPLSLSNKDIELQDSDLEMQHKSKVEDNINKVPEKINMGFPVSDGIGRLQIIKNSDLEELRELGSGTFGTVYHGKWRGTDVAIKRINDRCFAGKPSEQERMRDDFWNEAIKLADLHHPNVVAFYGVVLDGPGGSVATVTEYMVNGSLRNSLQKNEKNLDKRKRLLIAMDVAFGMEYLHGKNIVHFDLKSDNLLVNLRDPHRPICKVGDLGLSKVKCQTLISGGVRGTLPWMAPELLNGSSSLVSEKVDVFSFGIVMWELLTGEEPYADLHYGAIIGGIVSNTLRPSVPEFCDPEWRALMERCWSSEPSERPSFTEIANQLRSMAAKIPPKGQISQPQVQK